MGRITFGQLQVKNRTAELVTSISGSRPVMAVSVFRKGGGINNISVPDKTGRMVDLLFTPKWPTLDPDQICPPQDERFAIYGKDASTRRRAGSMAGSNLCFPWVGPDERGLHGEYLTTQCDVLAERNVMTLKSNLGTTNWDVSRTLEFYPGEGGFRMDTIARNRKGRQNVTWLEHLNIGHEFAQDSRLHLPEGTRVFNNPAKFHPQYSLFKPGGESIWPYAAGNDGSKIDISTFEPFGRAGMPQSDFASLVFPAENKIAWFILNNAVLGIALIAAWDRARAPFMGRWIENMARDWAPWGLDGKPRTQVMGLEPGDTPFSSGLSAAIELGKLGGQVTYATVAESDYFVPAAFHFKVVPSVRVLANESFVLNEMRSMTSVK